MGYITTFDLVGAIAALEAVLSQMGMRFELGAGIAAFEKTLFQAQQAARV